MFKKCLSPKDYFIILYVHTYSCAHDCSAIFTGMGHGYILNIKHGCQ